MVASPRKVELVGGPMDGRTIVLHEGCEIRYDDPNVPVTGRYVIQRRGGDWLGFWESAFEGQVKKALDEIPHSEDCGVVPGMPGGPVHECTCNRDAVIGHRVADALELFAREIGEDASSERGTPTDPSEAERITESYRQQALKILRGES
jgi:hypothetical protein